MAARYDDVFRGLLRFREQVGAQLVVLIIPDEFQLNDALWRQLQTRLPHRAQYRRRYPQERILAFCREQDILAVDALPAMATAQERRRMYHRRDSHLNAEGNRVLASVLTEALLPILAGGSTSSR